MSAALPRLPVQSAEAPQRAESPRAEPAPVRRKEDVWSKVIAAILTAGFAGGGGVFYGGLSSVRESIEKLAIAVAELRKDHDSDARRLDRVEGSVAEVGRDLQGLQVELAKGGKR